MSTINSKQHRFLQICVGIGFLGTLPFIMHPLGLNRPDGWIFSVLVYLLPLLVLPRFQPAQPKHWSKVFFRRLFLTGILCEVLLIGLLVTAVMFNHLPVDWTFAGFKGWVEIQIGQQIEATQAPMPGIPADLKGLSQITFWSSFVLPWFLWWGALPQELVWRGWVAQNKPQLHDWCILSTYWTLWQLPQWLLAQQWHWGWWQNNGLLFIQQVISTWLVGVLLVGIRQRTESTIISALIVSLLTISQVWPIMLQDFSPAPQWLWIGWNGWIGCILMTILIQRLSQKKTISRNLSIESP